MRPNRLQNALTALGDAMREVNAAIDEMRRGPRSVGVAHFCFVPELETHARHQEGQTPRYHRHAQLAIGLRDGISGGLGEWERLMSATPKR
jgi:hypothetical protein